MITEDEHPAGTEVIRPGYSYRGRIVRYETKHRTRFVVISWNGRTGATRENPATIEPAAVAS